MKNRPAIETKRLILRPFEFSDAKKVQEHAGDFSIADTTLNMPHPYEDGMAEQWIATHQDLYEAGELINYAITLKPEMDIIGTVGLAIDQRFPIAELGYWIANQFWNKGICTEAANALIDYAFNIHNLHKIIATHMLRNPASGRVMQKLGMTLEGTFKEHILKWGKWEDVNSYGILKSEWKNIERKHKQTTSNF